jgi:ADP-heptose:LPS heptosyltransferase
MANGEDLSLRYPAPLAPMVGHYLVRKKYVAAGISVIDACCSVFAGSEPRGVALGDASLHSILISQCGHLGDLIMTLPALHWIRRNRPQLKIGLVVGSWAKPMLHGIAELYDACYFADHFMLDRSDRSLKDKLARHRSSWRTAAVEIRQDRHDAAIECFPFLPNSIPLLRACGIPVRVGFTCGGFGPLLTHKAVWRHASRPFLDYPRDLLRLLFTDGSLDRPFQAYYPAPAIAPTSPRPPYVVVHTGTGNPTREWQESRWTELVRELTIRPTTVVLAGAGPRERERAARIANTVGGGVVNLCDKLSWDEFAALVAGAAHVVCLDSSTCHLAASFRIPSTVIMPATNDPLQFGPASDQARILTFPTPCAPCFRSMGCDQMACIRRVSVAEATEAVLGRLEMVV